MCAKSTTTQRMAEGSNSPYLRDLGYRRCSSICLGLCKMQLCPDLWPGLWHAAIVHPFPLSAPTVCPPSPRLLPFHPLILIRWYMHRLMHPSIHPSIHPSMLTSIHAQVATRHATYKRKSKPRNCRPPQSGCSAGPEPVRLRVRVSN